VTIRLVAAVQVELIGRKLKVWGVCTGGMVEASREAAVDRHLPHLEQGRVPMRCRSGARRGWRRHAVPVDGGGGGVSRFLLETISTKNKIQ
jgi:hypothetical protein